MLMFWCHDAAAASPAEVVDCIAVELPVPGDQTLHVLAPDLLELVHINTTTNDVPVSWDLVNSGVFNAPATNEFEVRVGMVRIPVIEVGFKRRPLYAPLKLWDLRISNHLFLRLAHPIPDGLTVEVLNPSGTLWSNDVEFKVVTDPLRYSPALHVNQEGYVPTFPKRARVGYYLGDLGELEIDAAAGFSLVDEETGTAVFHGALTSRVDVGFNDPVPYQKVLQADFSSFTTVGLYRLCVPGLGASLPFRIHSGAALNLARAYALGMYHQRCGTNNAMPFTRHEHAACHTAPTEVPVPESSFAKTWELIAAVSSSNAPDHTAMELNDEATQLYPYVARGTVDTSGGHHDAGDYSKYTTSCARLIEGLMFAVDAFPGVATMDHLGIPESGDGIPDLLQEAKWEADFVAKLQDDDGGFFFLVYPKHRKYEGNALPEDGDPQVVWPKNTAATASAVAVLAQCASSPTFRRHYPVAASNYMQKAWLGWTFLTNAIATHGMNGAYQKITHYGDLWMHNDELAWAAASLYAATGDTAVHGRLLDWYDPEDPETRRWGWWWLNAGYGAAPRAYAFAARTGRLRSDQLDATFLAKCETALLNGADAVRDWSNESAYGISYASASKRFETAGWFFAASWAFDLCTAYQIDPRTSYADAVLANVDYEAGANPINVSYTTGCGWKRQREIVHQYAQNDHRVMPPSGIPLGSLQNGFDWMSLYGSSLGSFCFPRLFPMYDRWGDSFNVQTEFTVAEHARCIGTLAWLTARSGATNQAWSSSTATLVIGPAPADRYAVGLPVPVSLATALDCSDARIVWEGRDREPAITMSTNHVYTPVRPGRQWVEVEAQWPDGRRVFATNVYWAVDRRTGDGMPHHPDTNTLALYHFDGNYTDAGAHGFDLTLGGNAVLVDDNLSWMRSPTGQVVRCRELGDRLTVSIPDSYVMPGNSATPLALDAWIYPRAYKAYGVDNASILALESNWDAVLGVKQDKWGHAPRVVSLVPESTWKEHVAPHTWNHLRVTLDTNGVQTCWVNGVALGIATNGINYGRTVDWTLTIGNMDADIDEVWLAKSVPPAPLPWVSVTAGDAIARESRTNSGEFVVSRRGELTDPLTVRYRLDGTASNGVDYTALPGTVVLAAGVGSVPVLLTPIDDNDEEPTETARLVLIHDAAYTIGTPAEAEVAIADNDMVVSNMPPHILISGATSVTLPATATFTALVFDDGLPAPPGVVTQSWRRLSGPATATFSDATGLTTTVTFPTHGEYTLTVTAYDGTAWGAATVTVTVAQQTNQPPTVAAGQDADVVLPATAALNGSVSDDGLPHAPGVTTSQWSVLEGPAPVMFDDVTVARTRAVFTTPGRYVLRLTADDGEHQRHDDVVINVFTERVDHHTVAMYHFDEDFNDSSSNGFDLAVSGTVLLTNDNLGWMYAPTGRVARFSDVGDTLSVTLPDEAIMPGNAAFSIEAMLYPRAYKAHGVANVPILELYQNWDAAIGVTEGKWASPACPSVRQLLSAAAWQTNVTLGAWHALRITADTNGVWSCYIDDTLRGRVNGSLNVGRTTDWTLTLGNIDADIDEVRLSSTVRLNRTPVVEIQRPPARWAFTEGVPVAFVGTAIDPETGPLSGASVWWSSDRSGLLGTGVTFDSAALSIGRHTITLAAVDRGGVTGSVQHVIQVVGDTDRDGMPDWWELKYFSDAQAADPAFDHDADGVSTLAEWVAGTDPKDPASVLRIDGLQVDAAGRVTLVWRSTSNRYYTVLSAPEPGGGFLPLTSILPSLYEGFMSFTNTLPAPSPTRFYRVRVTR